MGQADVKFKATKKEMELIALIAKRAQKWAPLYDEADCQMDIDAVHSNGCKLRLEDFLAADDFNFAHDLIGIHRHIDRNTGKLKNNFFPRFAAPPKKKKGQAGYAEVLATLITLGIIAFLFGAVLLYSRFECGIKARRMGLPSDYGPVQGCMIETKSGWIQMDKYRIMGD